MSQDPRHGQGPGGGLPDFTGDDPAPLPAYDGGGPTIGEPSDRSRRRSLVIVLSVIGTAVVLLAIVALVLSQTVFRSPLSGGDPTAYPTEPRTDGPESEYVPDPDDPDIAPPPPIFTEAPTVPCEIPSHAAPATPSSADAIRGGDLEYTLPDAWDRPWGTSPLPYLTEVDGQGRNVEGSWFSVVSLGRVDYTDSEYPGLEQAAVDIFQCYATTSGVLSHFGENPVITDYRTESTVVDGYPAWIVQATYNFEDPDILETSSASIVTSIVVEGPNGPSALASDVAADHPDHVAELEQIIESLRVVS